MRLSIFTSVMTAALLAGANTVGAATPEVRDEAGFFKPETITAASKIISDIKRDDKKDLVVRTFLHAPNGKEQEAENKDTKAALFKNWADQQLHDEGINGVYVLICKNPPHVQVAVSAEAHETFSDKDRDHLDQLLLASFKNKKYDEGLLDGVRYVQTALQGKNAAAGGNVAARGVHDGAGFFKPDAITKANEIISAIKRDDKKDLLIQTYLQAPARKEQEAKDADTKANFFKQWADQLGREQKVNGVVVLICKDPPYLKVVADNRTAKIFNEEARIHLSTILQTHFKSKDYDDGLLEGVRYVQTMLKGKGNSAGQTGAAAASPWGNRGIPGAIPRKPVVSLGWAAIGGLLCVGLFVIITIGVVLMGIMAIFRSFHRGPSGYGGPGGYGPVNPGGYGGGGYGGYGGGYGGGQGGGFLSSMLGGLFGGAAGGWAYDRFFGGHQGQAPNPTPREYGAPPPQQDAGYSGGDDAGGGDFGGGGGGDTGGGADFGGGDDAGGGDFGGGDAGGSDFGGGGDTGGGGDF